MRTAARATPRSSTSPRARWRSSPPAVAKTGDMKITTPTATLGIRGTTGLVEVPEGAAANNPQQRRDQALSRCRRQGRPHRGQRPRRRAARLSDAGRQRLHHPARRGRRALRRGAAGDFAAADAARPGFRAPGPLDAESRAARSSPSSATSAAPIRDCSIRTGPTGFSPVSRGHAAAEQAAAPEQSLAEPSRAAATDRACRTGKALPAGRTAGRNGAAGLRRRNRAHRARASRSNAGSPNATRHAAAHRPTRRRHRLSRHAPAAEPPRRCDRSRSRPRNSTRSAPTQPRRAAGTAGIAEQVRRCPDCSARRGVQGAPALQRPGSAAPAPTAARACAVNAASRRNRICASSGSLAVLRRRLRRIGQRAASPIPRHQAERTSLTQASSSRPCRTRAGAWARRERSAPRLRRRRRALGPTPLRRRQRDRTDIGKERALIAARQPLDGVVERQPVDRLDVVHQLAWTGPPSASMRQ